MKTAEEILTSRERKLTTLPPEATLYQAIKTLVNNRVGSILVEENGELVGIWTERDFIRNSLDKKLNIHEAQLKDFMHQNLHFANHNETVFQLMDKFLGLRIRQILIKKDDKYIGILSSGDVIRENLKNKAEELKDLKQMFSWEYYENWNW